MDTAATDSSGKFFIGRYSPESLTERLPSGRKKERRVAIIDVLKVFACAFVIINHSSDLSVYEPFIYLAVPIFLILTGYNYTASCRRKNIVTVRQWYEPNRIFGLLMRILLPYAVFMACELVSILAIGADYKAWQIIGVCFKGGYGPGNYYMIMFVQVLLIFPFLYKLNLKRPCLTLVLSFLVTLLYEVMMKFAFPELEPDTNLGGSMYKYLFIRYIFMVDCGIFLYFYRKKISLFIYVALIVGGICYYAAECLGYERFFYIRNAAYTPAIQMISISVTGLCLKYLHDSDLGFLAKPFGAVSSATWHIFLVQQLYFYIISFRPFRYEGQVLNIVICFALGLAFYYAQTYLQSFLRKRKVRK